MKALIATGLGVLGLGGVLVANSGRSASAQASLAGPGLVSQTEAGRTTLVNCGEGRQALVFTDPRTGQSQVQCVDAAAYVPGAVTPALSPALPVSQQFAPAIVSPVQPAVQERVVYREAPAQPVYRAPARRSSASSARRTSAASAPVYESRGSEAEPVRQGRSWK